MSLASQIAKNTLYQVVSKILGTVIGLATIGLMTRYLGQTGYGYFTTTIAFLQFFGVLIDFGLQMTATQMLSRPEADQAKIFNNILTLRFFSSLIFLGSAAALGWLMPYPLIVKEGLVIAGFSFLFISLQSVLISVFQKNLRMAQTASAEILGRLVLLGGVYLAAAFHRDLLYFIGAVALGNLASLIILAGVALKYFKIRLEFDKNTWRKIWQTTWPLAITIALTLVYFRADTVVLSLFRPQNEVGLYGAAYKVLDILIQLPYLFLGLILPLLTNFFAVHRRLFDATLQKAFDFLALLALPMIFAALILGEKIMLLVAGPEFIISGAILKILIFAAGIIYLSALFGYAIVACELQKKMIKFYLADAVISLILYFWLIPVYSYWAAAYLTVLTEAIIMFSAFYVLKKNIGISLKFKTSGKALLASAVMAAVLYVFLAQNILVLIFLGTIIYFWALYLLRGVNKQMVLEMIGKKY